MNTQEKLAAIRAACVAANPTDERYECSCMLCIANQVRLADVLLAISKDWMRSEEDYNTWVFFGSQKNELLCVVSLWNLRNDYLAAQSPETIDFLYDLLKII